MLVRTTSNIPKSSIRIGDVLVVQTGEHETPRRYKVSRIDDKGRGYGLELNRFTGKPSDYESLLFDNFGGPNIPSHCTIIPALVCEND